MSTAKRRRGRSLHLELPNGHEDLPQIAAAFLVLFDVKAGYTIAWKRAIPGLELDESVEFKSLPSGLHNVQEDIIYFLHDDTYAGISAFVNAPREETDRNAIMLAVGALLPSHGRLGKSWKHAEGLIELARALSKDPENKQPLEEFWIAHQIHEEQSHEEALIIDSLSVDKAKRKQGQASNGHARARDRAASTVSAMATPGQSLTPHHPALSLPTFLDTFGPLIFPLYKAALLRRRILLVGHAPVELACNFVYDISLLSSIPSSVSDLLPLEPLPTRLQPLFSVGVHDMSALSHGGRPSNDSGYGWVACTTDDILSHKSSLYDTLITLPPAHSALAAEKVWPTISHQKSSPEIKATQRDLRRYRTLRRELYRFPAPNPHTAHSSKPPTTPAIRDDQTSLETQENDDDNDNDEEASALGTDLAEPSSWSALAYNSFMWWASAGEKRTDLDEEEEYDAALLRPFEHYTDSGGSPSASRKSPGRSPGMSSGMREFSGEAGWELGVIAYFHRFTGLILKTLADVVDDADVDNDEGGIDGLIPTETSGEERVRLVQSRDEGEDARPVVVVESEDMNRMGLDVWSANDRDFVKELLAFYWGREAEVRGGRVECCGVRVF